MFGPKRYVVLGHSAIQSTNTNKTVPNKVHLVFMRKCGHRYSNNKKNAATLRSTNLTNNFLH